MIHEYAIEPGAVTTWTEDALVQLVGAMFGLGTPRVVSRLPSNWTQRVYSAGGVGSLSQGKRALLLREVVEILGSAFVKRESPYLDGKTWLENIEAEHARRPFQAIVAMENPRGHSDVLSQRDWWRDARVADVRTAGTPQGTAEALVGALAPMLRLARNVVLVDQYFAPDKPRFRNPLQRMFKVVAPGRTITYITGAREERALFVCSCLRHLPKVIPVGSKLKIRCYRERGGGERLHQRYVLTELGGVRVDPGLDEASGRGTYDLNLLDAAQFKLRWSQYAGQNPVFDTEGEEIVIDGLAR